MASSDIGISQHKYALFKKFQGNGWALSCSAGSRKDLSAILGDSGGGPTKQKRKISPPSPGIISPNIKYVPDWADKVVDRMDTWAPEENSAPLWLEKAAAGSNFALFQLSEPDRRWVVKFDGRILEPFDYRLQGWAELHELIVHGHLLDRCELLADAFGLADLKRTTTDILGSTELLRAGFQGEIDIRIEYSVTGQRITVPVTAIEGEEKNLRLSTCADDFNKQVRGRLDRVLNLIRKKDRRAAAGISASLHSKGGQWSFNSPFKWMTEVGEIPYDATMILRDKNWEVTFPDSDDPLVVPDGIAIRAIARLFICGNIACPSVLLVDGEVLSEFLTRPRHHKYFRATYRKPQVTCGEAKNTEVEQAICAAMRLRSGWWYTADHVIPEESDLHSVAGLPRSRVTLQRAEALEGILDLLKRRAAKLFFCKPPSPQFIKILGDIDAGIKFARKQEELLRRVQPESQERQDGIQKALYRLKRDLGSMGDWTTRYDRFGDHLHEHVKGGTVFQYTGPYRWKVEGISETPDSLDLAMDHIAYKRRKLATERRKAKKKMEAAQFLSGEGA